MTVLTNLLPDWFLNIFLFFPNMEGQWMTSKGVVSTYSMTTCGPNVSQPSITKFDLIYSKINKSSSMTAVHTNEIYSRSCDNIEVISNTNSNVIDQICGQRGYLQCSELAFWYNTDLPQDKQWWFKEPFESIVYVTRKKHTNMLSVSQLKYYCSENTALSS